MCSEQDQGIHLAGKQANEQNHKKCSGFCFGLGFLLLLGGVGDSLPL